MKLVTITCLAGVSLLIWTSTANAQESHASIIGRAIDPSGAVLSGATVKATNTATNATVDTIP